MTPLGQRLADALRNARMYVESASLAEHMLDGFGPRTPQPSDEVLAEVDEALAALDQPTPTVAPATKAPTVASEPLPCPFCGHRGVTVREGSTLRWRIAECINCGANAGETRAQTLGEGTPAEWETDAIGEAIEQWNCRTPAAAPAPSEPPDALEKAFG